MSFLPTGAAVTQEARLGVDRPVSQLHTSTVSVILTAFIRFNC